jgi:hypothetical protein
MSGVLRGFAPAAFEEAVCGVPPVRLDENPCPPSRALRPALQPSPPGICLRRSRWRTGGVRRTGEAGGLVRPCSSGAKHCPATKLLIYELETYPESTTCYVIYG